jgi:aspartate aminotransferase
LEIKLSNRVQQIKPSPTLAVTARAAQLRATGKDIIGLGAGEPDFDTPEHIKEAAIKAIHDGFTKYTAVDGTPGLKKAVVNKFARDNQLSYSLDQVIVSCGGKQSFFNLSLALINAGDEVIIPAPYWVSYPDMVQMADGIPVIIQAPQSQGFKITPSQLANAITPRTRLVVINSPSNPTGVAYTKSELDGLAEVLLRHPNVMVATDDMYEHILWADEPFHNILNVCPQLYDRTIVLNGVSKAYSMTGWRIGYAAGPTNLVKAMANVQSHSTSNPTSIAQVAAQAALDGPQDCIAPMLKAFKERHDYVVHELNQLWGVTCLPSDGTFYSFPDFTQAMQASGCSTDVEYAEKLLTTAEVALVPGSAFGAPGHMRLSFATSMENLRKAIDRLKIVMVPQK